MRRVGFLMLFVLVLGLGSGCGGPPAPSATSTPPRFNPGGGDGLKSGLPTGGPKDAHGGQPSKS